MNQQNNTTISFKGQHFFIGLDVHKKNWKVTIRINKTQIKRFSMDPSPQQLSNHLRKNYPEGTYHCVYESGFCGYWIHDILESFGIKSIVVNAADIPTTDKERVQKEDKRDSRKIARSLSCGNLTPIYIPSIKTQRDRSLLRTRAMLVKDLGRYKNRIKSFLYFYGISIDDSFKTTQSHWSNRFMSWLESIDMGEESGKEALCVLISECKNLRTSILNITSQVRRLSQTESYREQVILLRSIPNGTI